jgi:hypothetical protein
MVKLSPRARTTSEALTLFAELEHATQPDEDKAHQLARLLNLVPEWWSGCSVLDRSDGPVHGSPEYVEHRDWQRTAEVHVR